MSDVDLIYNALLRAEKRLEDELSFVEGSIEYATAQSAYLAARTIREELGNGLAALSNPTGQSE